MTPPGPRARPESSGWVATPKPGFLAGLPDARLVRLDVRDDVRAGGEPLARIVEAAGGLATDGVLVVRAPFEPVPLYGVLRRRGLAHWTERRGADDWSVWFYRAPGPGVAESAPAAPAHAAVAEPTIRLDVRGLEPPLPMVRILEGLDELAQGQRLEVVHDRRPMFLYPQLDDRGFLHETVDIGPGLVRITIRKGDGRP